MRRLPRLPRHILEQVIESHQVVIPRDAGSIRDMKWGRDNTNLENVFPKHYSYKPVVCLAVGRERGGGLLARENHVRETFKSELPVPLLTLKIS